MGIRFGSSQLGGETTYFQLFFQYTCLRLKTEDAAVKEEEEPQLVCVKSVASHCDTQIN